MITKERNAVMNINLPRSLKEDFTRLAYNLWTTPSNLLKMLMQNTITTRQVNLRANPFDKDDWEIEPLDVSNWSPESLAETDRLTKKLEKLLA